MLFVLEKSVNISEEVEDFEMQIVDKIPDMQACSTNSADDAFVMAEPFETARAHQASIVSSLAFNTEEELVA